MVPRPATIDSARCRRLCSLLKERCRAVAFVIVRHGLAAFLLQRKTRLGAIQCLDLTFLVTRQNDGVPGREPFREESADGEDEGFDLSCGCFQARTPVPRIVEPAEALCFTKENALSTREHHILSVS